ncbi:uncharacterized protein LOC135461686 [Liolophura sinensis]|uniref:uncharacterized protein LOC135461686 n=1 Tax=Liolophura sinensis TaxID=3198878 RepID=UPI00315952A8
MDGVEAEAEAVEVEAGEVVVEVEAEEVEAGEVVVEAGEVVVEVEAGEVVVEAAGILVVVEKVTIDRTSQQEEGKSSFLLVTLDARPFRRGERSPGCRGGGGGDGEGEKGDKREGGDEHGDKPDGNDTGDGHDIPKDCKKPDGSYTGFSRGGNPPGGRRGGSGGRRRSEGKRGRIGRP